MTKTLSLLLLPPLLLPALTGAFLPTPLHHRTTTPPTLHHSKTKTTLQMLSTAGLKPNDRVFLIGPSFLQLSIAKHLKSEGLIPMIIAPRQKIDGSFSRFLNDGAIVAEANIGLPDVGDPHYGDVKGVVFCSEEAVFGSGLMSAVLGWGGFAGGEKRVVVCAPMSNKVGKEKSAGWMPILNNDKKEKEIWNNFVDTWRKHPFSEGSGGHLLRFGTLLGGSVDGPEELEVLGLDESIYKMSLENYRDLKERSFDRLRLGAQILSGDTRNVKPPNQEKLENDSLTKGEYKEVFRASGGYPEQDRTNRHTVAGTVTQVLMRDGVDVPKEFTVLSKCVSVFPTEEEWDEMFKNPVPSKWPDPYKFDPSSFDWEGKEQEK